MDRWLAGAPFPTPSPEQLREAFLWAEHRLVRKDATIKLFGGVYETDPVLAGRSVECVFDPFDLTVVEVRWNGKPYGRAGRPAADPPPLPSQGQTGDPRRAAAGDRDRLPGHHRRRAPGRRPPPPYPLRRPRQRRGPGPARRRRAGEPVTGQPPQCGPPRSARSSPGAARLTAAGRQRQHRRDRRLPHRQSRPARAHRRRARRRRLGQPRHRPRPPGRSRRPRRRQRSTPLAAAGTATLEDQP